MLTKKIQIARKAGRYALIPFITAGLPSKAKFWQTVLELDSTGADIIEIGVPFTDPVADGPVVARASQDALESGVSLAWLLEGLARYRPQIKAGIVLMGYANPFLQYCWPSYSHTVPVVEQSQKSLALLAQTLVDHGVNGLIVPDLNLSEADDWQMALHAKGIDLIPLVGPNTSQERLNQYAASYRGYVYVVSVLGTTGVRAGLPPELPTTLQRVRTTFNLPIALGFGLKDPAQLADFSGTSHNPDALVFGSALLLHLEKGGTAADFMQRWTKK